jgi:serine/threonine protein kinase/WD40 repeat protein
MDPDVVAARIEAQVGARVEKAAGSSRPVPRVPDHVLLARIGGGSYGDVWLARSVTGRLRAVKVVWRGNFASDRPYEREFRGITQFEPISRSHPGVVNVLHVGRDDGAGCFFYVMELADDVGEGDSVGRAGRSESPKSAVGYRPRTLAAELKARGRLPVADVLTLGVQLADALGHLHRHGLVHRDVKPSNVIFVEGQAKLADIGLIAGVDEARSFVGTEGFIPPEGPGTVQGDIFGLGRLVYEASTGKDRCDFPELPDDLDRWSDRGQMVELNEILARACAPKAKHRHANAAELAGDLNLLLSGRSIRRAYGMEERLRRVTQVAVGAGLVALLAGGGVWFQRMQRERADERARAESGLRGRAERAEQGAQEQLREALLQTARAITGSSDPDRQSRALAVLQRAAQVRSGLDLRNAALEALAAPEVRVARRWSPRTSESTHERPDSSLSRYSRRNADGTISVHSMADDAEQLRLPHVGVRADHGLFSPDGRWLAVKYTDQSLRVWDLGARTNLWVSGGVREFGFTADSRRLVIGGRERVLQLWDLGLGVELWRQRSEGWVDSLACDPWGEVFAVAGGGRTVVEVRRLSDGELERLLEVPELGWVVRWGGDGGSLITAHRDFSIRVWDWPWVESPRLILRVHRSEPVFMATDPAGRWLATAGWDNQLVMVDLLDGRTVLSRAGTFVHAAADRPAFLLANDADWSLVEFGSAFALETWVVHDDHKSPRDLAFSGDGRWVATGGQDGVRLLDRRYGEVHRVMTGEMAHRVGFDADSGLLVSVTPDRLRAWRIGVDPVTDRPCLERWEVGGGGIRGFSNVDVSLTGLSGDGRRWLSAVTQGGALNGSWVSGRFDAEQVETLGDLAPNSHVPEFSPDGRWLAWGNWRGNDAWVLGFGRGNGAVRLEMRGSAAVAFSPDSRLLVVGGATDIRFHEVDTWQLLHSVPRDPPGQIPPATAFTGDGALCAIVLPPHRVLLVNPETGEELATLPARHHFLVKAAFSPDQQYLAAVSTDHRLLIWDLERLRGRLRELSLDW